MNEQLLELWKRIIEDGIQAPSGDNSQPWEFVFVGDELEVMSIPKRDNPAYNLDQKGSIVAIGALLENMQLSAVQSGRQLEIQLFPNSRNHCIVARLNLAGSISEEVPLYPFIHSRCTNRKPYRLSSLASEERLELLREAEKFSVGKILFIEEPVKINILAGAASLNERVVLENFRLHQYFFEHVRWTEEEEREKCSGLFLPTLEFDSPTKFLFSLLKNWRIMNIVNKIGFAKLVAKTNAKIYAQSTMIGLIVLDNDVKENYVEAGRMLQRFWLTVESLGLSMQMITGVLYFMQRIRANKVEDFFKPDHVKEIQNSYQKICNVFGVSSGTPILMFRVGSGGRPSARSGRRKQIIHT